VLPFDIPSALAGYADRGPDWAAWVDSLPRLVRDVVEEWGLGYDGPPRHGECALVVPVRTGDGCPAMLKLSFPDDESEHEYLGLRTWQGNGAVRLLRADPNRWALLLERLHAGEDLTGLWDIDACEVVAGFYRRLHVPAPPQLRPLTSYVDRWTEDLAGLRRSVPVPHRLVEQAVSLGRSFVADDATDGTMIHCDLHYFNVLAADREPWLVIDPKPLSGDPHYEVAPLLWNRWDEVVESGRVRDAVRRRFLTVVDAAGLDEARARDWVVVREMHNALWTIQDARARDRALGPEDRDWLTTSIAVAKAVQD
jgi:streptomycin 6-kinase